MPFSKEHSKNKIIMQSGCLKTDQTWSSPVQHSLNTNAQKRYEKNKPSATRFVSILFKLCEIFADFMFLEQWAGALQVQPRF